MRLVDFRRDIGTFEHVAVDERELLHILAGCPTMAILCYFDREDDD